MKTRTTPIAVAPPSLERAVLEAVAYADVFDYPVTLDDITRTLPVKATRSQVEALLAPGGSLQSYIRPAGRFYVLAGREHLAAVRLRRGESSARLMRTARAYGSLLSKLPFVRMVAVTGSVAVENAEAGDDIDYLIVTAKGRLWLARGLAILVVRLAGLRGVTLCPNYLLAESNLALPDRDVYTARELLQMRPIAGLDVYRRMLAENAWCRDLLPNWRPPIDGANGRRSLLTRLGEAALGGRLGDRLERWLLRGKGGALRAQAGDNSEATFDEDVCKGHFDSHRARLQAALALRLCDLEARR